MATKSSSIYFPIGNITGDAPMKPIPLTTLPNFHGMSFEDPDTFLFEFYIVYRGYDYIVDAQKLKIFPTTLKGKTLQCLMRLGGKTISSWDAMKEVFLEKYQDYFKSCDIKEDIFKFVQKEDENMEDCVERFKYILQSLGHSDLDKYILKIILLRELREDSLQILNIVGKGDVSKEEFDTICEYSLSVHRGLQGVDKEFGHQILLVKGLQRQKL